jgi:hypothetical protein
MLGGIIGDMVGSVHARSRRGRAPRAGDRHRDLPWHGTAETRKPSSAPSNRSSATTSVPAATPFVPPTIHRDLPSHGSSGADRVSRIDRLRGRDPERDLPRRGRRYARMHRRRGGGGLLRRRSGRPRRSGLDRARSTPAGRRRPVPGAILPAPSLNRSMLLGAEEGNRTTKVPAKTQGNSASQPPRTAIYRHQLCPPDTLRWEE